MNQLTPEDIERALTMLAAVLEEQGVAPLEIVVIGGAAVSVLGIRVRPTRDVDVLALRDISEPGPAFELVKSRPLPESLVAGAGTVAAFLGFDDGWLNAGPADLLDHGLPEGFTGRLTPKRYGRALTVHYASREDLVYFKVYAAADTGVGRHTEDLLAMQPTCDELLQAARWVRTHDPSPGFETMLSSLLRYMGCPDAAMELNDEA